ncbi:DNA-binding transcriptional regulator, MarR family [Fulvimarina manganoxydans]|uniref:DNA-binding transcriptional regulator, MarR family n=1 Tax=Fulvimarina manganoxydans TaxID=937218 RepID=A0A1W2DF42_9HYPH|nr:MarR family transcriptional regulator [Fulvimarina manganoxydans]SMC95568.1 DNA-binding transcriptional regulator, MarR family [Fulvimarina manganoxydans]
MTDDASVRRSESRENDEADLALCDVARLFKAVLRRAIARDRDVAARHDLALTDIGCLGFLESCHEPVSGKMVAEHVALSTGATTALLDRLERAGLIERQPNPADRRAIVIVLNEAKARPILEEQRVLKQGLAAAVGSLSQDERDGVLKFLQRLLDEVPE